MADLPSDHLSTEPPFTNMGLDVFGPWNISTCLTQGGVVNSKRWAVLLTYLSIHAVHIELRVSGTHQALLMFYSASLLCVVL